MIFQFCEIGFVDTKDPKDRDILCHALDTHLTPRTWRVTDAKDTVRGRTDVRVTDTKDTIAIALLLWYPRHLLPPMM